MLDWAAEKMLKRKFDGCFQTRFFKFNLMWQMGVKYDSGTLGWG